MTSTRLYLIRHGATSSNEQRPYVLQGSGIDLSLSENGKRQAELLGEFLAPFHFDAVFASPMKRAVETAEHIANPRNLSIETFAQLKEVDVGEWEGRPWHEIEKQHPTEYKAMMSDPWNNPYLGGESYSDVFRRTSPVLLDLIKKHAGKTIAVVAHQVVNRSFIAESSNIERHLARTIKQSNTGINVFKYTHDDGELQTVTVNSDFHLRTLSES